MSFKCIQNSKTKKKYFTNNWVTKTTKNIIEGSKWNFTIIQGWKLSFPLLLNILKNNELGGNWAFCCWIIRKKYFLYLNYIITTFRSWIVYKMNFAYLYCLQSKYFKPTLIELTYRKSHFANNWWIKKCGNKYNWRTKSDIALQFKDKRFHFLYD